MPFSRCGSNYNVMKLCIGRIQKSIYVYLSEGNLNWLVNTTLCLLYTRVSVPTTVPSAGTLTKYHKAQICTPCVPQAAYGPSHSESCKLLVLLGSYTCRPRGSCTSCFQAKLESSSWTTCVFIEDNDCLKTSSPRVCHASSRHVKTCSVGRTKHSHSKY